MSESEGASSAVLPMLPENFGEVTLLRAVEDDYGGVIVEVTDAMDPGDFSSSLRASLSLWRHQVRTGFIMG